MIKNHILCTYVLVNRKGYLEEVNSNKYQLTCAVWVTLSVKLKETTYFCLIPGAGKDVFNELHICTGIQTCLTGIYVSIVCIVTRQYFHYS